jgi:deoxyribodipyrimidine photo-lyase
MKRTIVWFRRDLRLCDHEPLYRAALRGEVIPVFIFDRALLYHPETAVARVAFMIQALTALDQDLRRCGGRLIIRSGDPASVLPKLITETQAEGIYATIDYERIYGRVRDARVNQALAKNGQRIRWFEPTAGMAELMAYPKYRSHWFKEMSLPMIPTPETVQVPAEISSEPLPSLLSLGMVADRKKIPAASTKDARELLHTFFTEKSDRYYWQLSLPSAEATTGLSPHIKFGVISVRECFQTAQNRLKGETDRKVRLSLKQLISRLRWGTGFTQRFRYLPQLELRSLYTVFEEDGWAFDEKLYAAWQTGETGFPIIDAAARCLEETGGWLAMNFRTRAIYSSFLSNLLGMDWRYGALHFMRHLIDGDCPIDHYQWAMQAGVTHCLDKSWTRIYNPEQAAIDRCDPQGKFIKRWIPELKSVAPVQLGMPPKSAGYIPAILNYKQARQQRVKQLELQRLDFRQTKDVLPFLARMPESVVPFGSDRFESEIQWTKGEVGELFPPALDLEGLDLAESQALRSWLVAHVNVTARKSPPGQAKVAKQNMTQQKPTELEAPFGDQLDFLGDLSL